MKRALPSASVALDEEEGRLRKRFLSEHEPDAHQTMTRTDMMDECFAFVQIGFPGDSTPCKSGKGEDDAGRCAAAASGTRVLELRSVSICSDFRTGKAGCADGYHKLFNLYGNTALAVPYVDKGGCNVFRKFQGMGTREVCRPTAVKEESLACVPTFLSPTKYLVQQTGPQCYLTSVVNALLSMRSFQSMVRSVVQVLKASAPALFDIVTRRVSPLTEGLPLGLAALQVFWYHLTRTADFNHCQSVNCTMEVLEVRMFGTANTGSSPCLAATGLLGSLGLSFEELPSGRTRTPGPKQPDFAFVFSDEWGPCDPTLFRCAAMFCYCVKPPSPALHAVACVDTNLIVDPNNLTCLKRNQWRRQPPTSTPLPHPWQLDPLKKPMQMFVSRAFESSTARDAIVSRVVHCACLHFEVPVLFVLIKEQRLWKLLADKRPALHVFSSRDGEKRVVGAVAFSPDGRIRKQVVAMNGALAVGWRSRTTLHPQTVVFLCDQDLSAGSPDTDTPLRVFVRTERGNTTLDALKRRFPAMHLVDDLPPKSLAKMKWLTHVLPKAEAEWVLHGRRIC